MAVSVLDKLKALDAERAKLLNDAKKEAMDKVEAAINDLNSLGFNYRITEVAGRSSTGGEARKGTRTPSNKPCPICNFLTEPPHDARKHRSQAEKKPFTAEECAALGMTKVS